MLFAREAYVINPQAIFPVTEEDLENAKEMKQYKPPQHLPPRDHLQPAFFFLSFLTQL